MKTTLLLNNEARRARLMLQNIGRTEAIVRETVAVAGCNCDRWGHPCPGCNDRKVQARTRLPVSSPTQQAKVITWNT
jgi:hypothetical protein